MNCENIAHIIINFADCHQTINLTHVLSVVRIIYHDNVKPV
jgi:hypothetical protein